MTEEHIDTEAQAEAGAAGDARTPGEAEANASEAAITGELRRMGERLASAIKAATGTPEAEELRGEVGEGLRKLRGELEGVLRRGKEAPATDEAPVEAEASPPEPDASASQGRGAGGMQSTVRYEIANALRSLNGALDRLAGSIAPGGSEEDDSSGEA